MNRHTAARATAELRQVAEAAAAACPGAPAAADFVRQLRSLEAQASGADTPMASREVVATATQLARQLHRALRSG